ncbi:MAG: DUF4147 domain-containing protein [Dehalococcoidales bacterium]|nr:DUF4147 domain-containing protein [Dehalococcoidales bacterium]
MIVKNHNILATTNLRKQVLDIIEAGIDRVLPRNIMMSTVRYSPVQRSIMINNDIFSVGSGRIFVVGGGKASGLMAEAFEDIVGIENIVAGAVNCKGEHPTRKIKTITASHPIPDQQGIYGVEEMLALKHRYSICENDLIICLISGGSSALMPCPVAEVSLSDKQITTELLISSGAEIGEINMIRKHLSRIKGGQLGKFYSPATVISLILSDVIGNDLSVVASGPTVSDSSTFLDAYEVLKSYQLLTRVPKNAIDFLRKGCRGYVAETPKVLYNCHNYLIGDNRIAVEAMLSKAKEMGLSPHIVTTRQSGNTTDVALLRANEVLNKKYADYNVHLIGGETTIKLPTFAGKGGRNQHYAAVSMKAMAAYPGEWVVASIGSDGSDFLSDVAGAIIDQNSIDIARAKEIDVESYIERCDSNTLFELIGNSLIITGDTGTNVGDIMVYLTI